MSLPENQPRSAGPGPGAVTGDFRTIYATPDGRQVGVVYSGSDVDPYRPIRGEGGTVRVAYLVDGEYAEQSMQEYGYADPEQLTLARPLPAGDEPVAGTR